MDPTDPVDPTDPSPTPNPPVIPIPVPPEPPVDVSYEYEVLVPNPLREEVSTILFELPKLLLKTGTPYEILAQQGISVFKRPDIQTELYDWIQERDDRKEHEDISYWLDVLPYDQDKNADRYIVLPRVGVVAPIMQVARDSVDYDAMIDGREINVRSYLANGVLQHVG